MRDQGLLHLDVGTIRTPITIFAGFTSLVTSAFATFVSQLAASPGGPRRH